MQRLVILVVVLLNLCDGRHYHQNYQQQSIDNVLPVESIHGGKYNPYSKHHPGRHVCTAQKNSTIPVKTKQTLCRPIYKKYYVKCGNGNQMCAGVKLVYETYYKDVITTKNSNEITYVCCPGWTQHSNRSHGCNKPVCTPPCQNGGKCGKPGVCVCPPQFTGPACETEIEAPQDYCSKPCHNGGTCLPKGVCSCAKGFHGRFCEKDIDECLEQKPCDHICYNTVGSYTCQCKETFVLQKDGQTCRKEVEDETPFEARDLEYEVLDKRLKKLENGMEDNEVTKKEIKRITNNIDILTNNIQTLRNEMKYIETHKKEMFFLRTRLNMMEKKTNKIDEFLIRNDKVRNSR